MNIKGKFADGEWIIGGDFNAIKHHSERKGRSSIDYTTELNAIVDFIDDINLIDVPCKGKRFSWYSGDWLSMSRLDRFLVADSIVNKWGVVGQQIISRDIFDHCPIWLVKDNEDWGPKTFNFNNEWFSFKYFIPFVEN